VGDERCQTRRPDTRRQPAHEVAAIAASALDFRDRVPRTCPGLLPRRCTG